MKLEKTRKLGIFSIELNFSNPVNQCHNNQTGRAFSLLFACESIQKLRCSAGCEHTCTQTRILLLGQVTSSFWFYRYVVPFRRKRLQELFKIRTETDFEFHLTYQKRLKCFTWKKLCLKILKWSKRW